MEAKSSCEDRAIVLIGKVVEILMKGLAFSTDLPRFFSAFSTAA